MSITVDWQKVNGLVPAIVQDAKTGSVLMLGYMDKAALAQTQTSKRVTFFSRSKNRLWVKGETSGHYLQLVSMAVDCDQDTLLVLANPQGPTCHLQQESCFGEVGLSGANFLSRLEARIRARQSEPSEGSYTNELFSAGIKRIAQKVGEEAVEVGLAAVSGDKQEATLEAADLLYHLLVLLAAQGLSLADAVAVLQQRHVQ